MSEEEEEEKGLPQGIIDEMEMEIEDGDVDPRLTKAVETLIKQSGIEKEKLKGKTIPEQFDLLSFYMDNRPKKKKVKKTITKNEPIIPIPIGADVPKIGRIVKSELGGSAYLISPAEWINKKKNKT